MKIKQAFLTLTIFLTACVNNTVQQSVRDQEEPARSARMEQPVMEEAQRAEEESRSQAEITRLEREEMARVEREEELARQEAERQRELEAEEARRLAAEARMADAREAEELRQAETLVRQQARIEELSRQVQMLNEQAQTVESANEVLNEALEAAEAVTAALSEESQKFNDINPESGMLPEAIDMERLDELTTRLEQLRAQAASLQAQ